MYMYIYIYTSISIAYQYRKSIQCLYLGIHAQGKFQLLEKVILRLNNHHLDNFLVSRLTPSSCLIVF